MTISDAGNIQKMRVWVMRPKPSIPQIDQISIKLKEHFQNHLTTLDRLS